MNERPIAIDLFAGAGPMALGFEQAGFDVCAAVEIDPVHCAVHKYNFPNCAIIPRSVASLSGAEILEIAGITGPVDCVFGGPPCQGFSLMGKREQSDTRNDLIAEFMRIVGEIRPRYFVMENVKGLTYGTQYEHLDRAIQSASDHGYSVSMPWRILNAADFGVPQNRQRLFLIGYRDGENNPGYPGARSQRVTCGQALAGLPNADLFHALERYGRTKAFYGVASNYAMEMHCEDLCHWHKSYRRKFDRTLLTNSIRTKHSAQSMGRFEQAKPGTVEPVSRLFKLCREGQCNTLRAGTDSARGAFTSPRPIHFACPRVVTVREMARLHGIPDWFGLHETKWHGARQIGNSVPPPLARAVASKIVEAMGIEIDQPQEMLDLGDPDLVHMTATEAAAHFGVKNPIKQRDRKTADE